MSDVRYIYGQDNGDSYTERQPIDGDVDGCSGVETVKKTHWDPRISVQSIAHTVQVGVIRPAEDSTEDQGVWRNEDGQFLSLSRDGLNRLIEALQEAGRATYGVDRW